MSIINQIGELAKSALTMDVQLKHQTELVSLIRQEVQRIDAEVHDLGQRVTRLETARDADRAHLETEITRFKLEVERAELRFSRMLPPGESTMGT